LKHDEKRAAKRPPFLLLRLEGFSVAAVIVAVVIAVVVSEVEQVEEITDGRAVEGHVGIIVVHSRIREVIAAAVRKRLQIPIPLDELEDGDVVGVRVADVAAAGER
jgi:hypothetical protein